MSTKYVEDEAEREEEENTPKYRDSSEEEDDDVDDYEKDDFIVDEEEVLSDDDQDRDSDRADDIEISRHRKKDKRKRRKYREDSPELAEGDFELLEEKGLHVNRKKKLRRLRKGASDDEADDLDAVYRGLAGDYEDEDEGDRRRDVDENFDYDDDLDDFIDDGGRGRRRRIAERKGLVSSEAVRAARSIFGDAEEMMQYKATNQYFQHGDQPGGLAGSDEEDDDDFLPEDEDEEGTPRPRRRNRRVDETRSTESALRAMAATTLDDDAPEKPKIIARFVTPDIPERLIKHFGDKYATPSQQALKKQAEWIYNYGFRDDLNIGAMRYPPERVIEKIAVFLQYVHRDKLDIPFIAMYRKDYITPELVCDVGENPLGRGTSWNEDPPPTPSLVRGFNSYQYDGYRPGLSIEHLRGVEPGYDDGFGDWSTLWKIMDWDQKFAEFNRRRQRLIDASQSASQKGVPESVIDQVVSSAKLSDNELQLADCERFLRLSVELHTSLQSVGGNASNGTDEKPLRRPSRRRYRYSDFCKKGYRGLSEMYGLSATQFAENVHNGAQYGPTAAQTHLPLDCDDEPLEAARLFARRLREETVLQASTLESDPSRLLAAARLILVKEMTSEIFVAQAARLILNKEGTVTVDTNPTPRGLTDVDDAHPLRPVTFIAGKKLERFSNSVEFALILRAVDLGFTKVKINFQEEQVHQLSQILQKAFFCPPNGSVLVDKWNAERKLVADQVLEELKVQIRKEIREMLLDQTTETLKRQMTQAASRRLLLGPCRPYPTEDGAPVVLAISVTREEDEEPDKNQARKDMEDAAERGRGNSARRVAPERLTFVVVDDNGEYVSNEELFAYWLRRPPRTTPPEQVKNQLKTFIKRMKPNVIVVGIGSGGRAAIRLKDDIRFVLHEMLNTGQLDYMVPIDQRHMFQQIRNQPNQGDAAAYRFIDPFVMCVDDWPAKIYAHCKWATVGLPVDGMTLLEKRAIALARLAQEPLTVYAGICSDRDVAPKFKLHQYHYFLKASERVHTLTRALIRAVCTNGVDINRVLSLPHTKPLVQYVGGLGEHKANALIRTLEAALSEDDKGLPSRKHLWNKDFMGRTVFMSAAAFLRVRDPELHNGGSTSRAVELRKRILERRSRGRRRDDDDADAFYDPMDDSRIHPEHYAVAIKIADEALRDDEGQLRIDLNDANGQLDALRVTSAVLDRPEGLRRLALDEYAEHLFKLRRGKLYETVKLVAREFYGPYKDCRRSLVAPTPQAMFYMVTGADPMEFRVGAKVTATNCRIADTLSFIMCSLPHNVRGSVDRYDFADEQIEEQDLKKLVTEGSSLACRILRFEYDHFKARLTSKPSMLKDPKSIQGYIELVNVRDDCYRPYPAQATGLGLEGPHAQSARDAEMLLKSSGSTADEVRRRKMSRLRMRAKSIVNHRLFRDISGPDAVETLRNALPGDVIIRPSAYNKDAFVFSSKFAALEPLEGAVPRDVFHIEFKVEKDPNNSNNPTRITIGTDVFEQVDEALEQFLHPIIGNLKEGLDHRKFRNGGEEQLKKVVAAEKKAKPGAIPYYLGLSDKRDLHMFIAYVPGQSTPRTEYIRVVPHGYKLRDVLHRNVEAMCQWFKKNMTKGMTVRRPGTETHHVYPASPFAAPGTPRSQSVPMSSGPTPVIDAPPPRAIPQPVHAVAQNPFAGPVPAQNGARPVVDVPPPLQAAGRGTPARPVDWNRATPSIDAPPPVQNGSGTPGQYAPRREPYRQPPAPRDHPMPDVSGRPMSRVDMRAAPMDMRDPPPYIGRGDMRGQPSHMGRGGDMLGPPAHMGRGDMRGSSVHMGHGDMRGPHPHMGRGGMRGPPNRGPPMRGPRQNGPPSPRGGAGRGRGASRTIPAWAAKQNQQSG